MNNDRLGAIAALTAPEMDYEIVPGEVWGRPCRMFKNAPPTLRDLYQEASSDETFLVFDDERYTFAETNDRVAQIANMLKDQFGVNKGDRVAISMRNFPEWVFAFNAVTSIGAIAVAMNALWISEEMAFGLKDSGAKVLFADQERLERLAPFIENLELDVIAVRATNKPSNMAALEELLAGDVSTILPDVEIDPGDPATILYTSGSTGHPKGAVSCHRNIVSALLSWELDGKVGLALAGAQAPQLDYQLDYQLAALLAVPLFHATGSHAVLLASYRSQRKIVLMYKWDVEEAQRLIETEKVAVFIAPAAMTGDLEQAARTTTRDLNSLLTVGGGGAPRAPDQVRKIAGTFEKALPNTGWGMTETNAIGTGIGGEDYVNHPGSSGRVSALLDLRVLDESGKELPSPERGELQIRGVSIIKGYWNREEANLEAFDGEWLRTGDVAYIDAEGYLYIVDRIKDLVIRGGENIGCAEVEAGLLAHPQIREASAYAVPDDRLGEEVAATIFADDAIDEDELRGFLLEHIAKFKIPRYLEMSSEPLPRIASGKIDKRQLREKFVSALG
ncbi:MAG: class I adenylate-forming enzyme family protein [Candidatus Azotimanducaceae bacterium WSBS_2022_MAG_OTU7]